MDARPAPRNQQVMQQINEPINRTLAMLTSLSTQSPRENSSLQPSPDANNSEPHPRALEGSPWRRKWLRVTFTHPELRRAVGAVEALAGRWFRKNGSCRLLVLCGNPGCGKTHLAKRLRDWADCSSFKAWEIGGWRSVPSVDFVSWPAVCDGFKSGNYGVIEDMIQSDFLFLDDIGAEHDPSKNATDKLCQILSRREEAFGLITTNIPMEQWGVRFDARIADRLMRNSEVVDMFNVPSYSTR